MKFVRISFIYSNHLFRIDLLLHTFKKVTIAVPVQSIVSVLF